MFDPTSLAREIILTSNANPPIRIGGGSGAGGVGGGGVGAGAGEKKTLAGFLRPTLDVTWQDGTTTHFNPYGDPIANGILGPIVLVSVMLSLIGVGFALGRMR